MIIFTMLSMKLCDYVIYSALIFHLHIHMIIQWFKFSLFPFLFLCVTVWRISRGVIAILSHICTHTIFDVPLSFLPCTFVVLHELVKHMISLLLFYFYIPSDCYDLWIRTRFWRPKSLCIPLQKNSIPTMRKVPPYSLLPTEVDIFNEEMNKFCFWYVIQYNIKRF